MQKPSKRQRRVLERAVSAYQAQIVTAATYLVGRGLTDPGVLAAARLGVVVSPEAGHEHLTGRLCIPYLDMMGVYGAKFRCMQDHDCKAEGCTKYLALQGQEVGVYGVLDTDSTVDTIHVSEGELDRLVLKQVFPGEPAVGIPGTQTWMPHHHYFFQGFDRVLLWTDGDKAGQDLAQRIRKEVRAAEVMPLPRGLDVTELFVERGADVFREMAGATDDE